MEYKITFTERFQNVYQLGELQVIIVKNDGVRNGMYIIYSFRNVRYMFLDLFLILPPLFSASLHLSRH